MLTLPSPQKRGERGIGRGGVFPAEVEAALASKPLGRLVRFRAQMTLRVLILVALLACAACDRPELSVSSTTTSARVVGSSAFPYVEAGKGEPADAVLELVATHVPSGETTRLETRLKRLSSSEWQKNSPYANPSGDAPGVVVSVNFSEKKNGRAVFDDSGEATILFNQDQRRSQGAIAYEATWKKRG